mmetsp:Transcript_1636/g.3777  ORF Transcript_1636/g.3777 Transcript_1636/m.3777 type:complete len:336 (-) Transcript_1636:272-1279(-)
MIPVSSTSTRSICLGLGLATTAAVVLLFPGNNVGPVGSISALRTVSRSTAAAVTRRPTRMSELTNREVYTRAGVTGLQRVATTGMDPTTVLEPTQRRWKFPYVLPKVYVYDHCPFCVRVRMIYGLKDIRHDLIWLQNDDKKTPSEMHPQNKKVLPIVDNNGKIIIESMDIVKAVDEDPTFGPPILRPATGRTDIDAWVKSTKGLMGALSRPRYIQAYLPEFAFKSAKDAFILNHPIDKSRFKKGDPGIFQEYKEALQKSPELLDEMNRRIVEVESMIAHPDYVSEGGLSYDDIVFFARMRGLTLIKGLRMGPRLREYLDRMAARTDIPLYSNMQV